ncbi:helix-turn-helix transcriptional regulator [Streptomyces sp. HNM0645]|uniref:helix-turn-helix domain-containing protein n=1 Tax=Streptomyces sp. HNM0645 TaxID=2782343 RepID=UPI0024B67F3E|nr:helix-turn-helix transcriptional regulator [Streptomyces sp. HNM0645]MDI9889412.1 helix-turn-helix transcriptional regulator [Streptomyces sp. HNM0645]
MAAQVKPIPADALPQLRALATQLRDAKDAAGISYKQLADRTHYSTASLSQAASGKKMPTWDVTRAYFRGCEDPREEGVWQELWTAASVADEARNSDTSPPAASPARAPGQRRRKTVAQLVREEVERQQQAAPSRQISLDAMRTSLALCITPDEFCSLLKELKGTRDLDEIKGRARSKGYTIRKFDMRTMLGDDGDEIPDTERLHAFLVGCDAEPSSIQDWHHTATRLRISQAYRSELAGEAEGLLRRLYLWLRGIRSEIRLETLVGLFSTLLVVFVQVMSILTYGF